MYDWASAAKANKTGNTALVIGITAVTLVSLGIGAYILTRPKGDPASPGGLLTGGILGGVAPSIPGAGMFGNLLGGVMDAANPMNAVSGLVPGLGGSRGGAGGVVTAVLNPLSLLF